MIYTYMCARLEWLSGTSKRQIHVGFTFRYYGISIWFPEYVKRLEQEDYLRHTDDVIDRNYVDAIWQANKLENIHFTNVTFYNVTFRNTKLIQVTFELCHFDLCVFQDVTSRRTYFRNSVLHNCTFNHTDLFASRFPGTELEDTHFYATATGCQVDFDYNFSQRWIFFETFVSQLAVIPSSVLCAFLLNRFGRVPIFGEFFTLVIACTD